MKGCQTHTRYAVIELCVTCECYEAVYYSIETFARVPPLAVLNFIACT